MHHNTGTPSSREKSDVVCKLPPDEPTASQQYPLESFEQVHKLSLEKALKEITPLTTKVTVDEGALVEFRVHVYIMFCCR